jgi:hypothetical protein
VTNRTRARVARAMETMMRVAGDEEGKGGNAMVMATRVAGERDGDRDKEGDGNEDEIRGRRGRQ